MFEPQTRLLSAAPFDHEPAQRVVDGSADGIADHAADDASDVGGGTATTSDRPALQRRRRHPGTGRSALHKNSRRHPRPTTSLSGVVHLMAPVPVFPREAAVEGTVAERMYRRRRSADKPFDFGGAPGTIRTSAPQISSCGSSAHTKLPNRQNERGDGRARDRRQRFRQSDFYSPARRSWRLHRKAFWSIPLAI
jgi:hypothetical protein